MARSQKAARPEDLFRGQWQARAARASSTPSSRTEAADVRPSRLRAPAQASTPRFVTVVSGGWNAVTAMNSRTPACCPWPAAAAKFSASACSPAARLERPRTGRWNGRALRQPRTSRRCAPPLHRHLGRKHPRQPAPGAERWRQWTIRDCEVLHADGAKLDVGPHHACGVRAIRLSLGDGQSGTGSGAGTTGSQIPWCAVAVEHRRQPGRARSGAR